MCYSFLLFKLNHFWGGRIVHGIGKLTEIPRQRAAKQIPRLFYGLNISLYFKSFYVKWQTIKNNGPWWLDNAFRLNCWHWYWIRFLENSSWYNTYGKSFSLPQQDPAMDHHMHLHHESGERDHQGSYLPQAVFGGSLTLYQTKKNCHRSPEHHRM